METKYWARTRKPLAYLQCYFDTEEEAHKELKKLIKKAYDKIKDMQRNKKNIDNLADIVKVQMSKDEREKIFKERKK